MDFNRIRVSGDVSGNITQQVNFWPLAVALVFSAVILVAGIGFITCRERNVVKSERNKWDSSGYWVTERSRVIHRSSCRYWGMTKGEWTKSPRGVNCKLCGGGGSSPQAKDAEYPRRKE